VCDSLPTTDRDGLPEPLARNLSRDQLPSLDGLRALAAYLVVYQSFTRCVLRTSPAFHVDAIGVVLLLSLVGKRTVWGQTFASLCYVCQLR